MKNYFILLLLFVLACKPNNNDSTTTNITTNATEQLNSFTIMTGDANAKGLYELTLSDSVGQVRRQIELTSTILKSRRSQELMKKARRLFQKHNPCALNTNLKQGEATDEKIYFNIETDQGSCKSFVWRSEQKNNPAIKAWMIFFRNAITEVSNGQFEY